MDFQYVKNSDTTYSNTCCDNLMFMGSPASGQVSCSKTHSLYGSLWSPSNDVLDCLIYKQRHYCSIEIKIARERAEREAKERAEREAKEKAEREAREKADKLRIAAEQGDANAQYELGLVYMEGRGVPTDSVKAKELITKAAEQGNEKAKNYLAEMERKAAGIAKKEKSEIIRKERKVILIGAIIGVVVGAIIRAVSNITPIGAIHNISSIQIFGWIIIVIIPVIFFKAIKPEKMVQKEKKRITCFILMGILALGIISRLLPFLQLRGIGIPPIVWQFLYLWGFLPMVTGILFPLLARLPRFNNFYGTAGYFIFLLLDILFFVGMIFFFATKAKQLKGRAEC